MRIREFPEVKIAVSRSSGALATGYAATVLRRINQLLGIGEQDGYTMNTVDDYIDLPYQVEMDLEQLPNGQWVYFARHPDLPDAMGHGDTLEGAARNLRSARRDV